jgi:hypothetical protein
VYTLWNSLNSVCNWKSPRTPEPGRANDRNFTESAKRRTIAA